MAGECISNPGAALSRCHCGHNRIRRFQRIPAVRGCLQRFRRVGIAGNVYLCADIRLVDYTAALSMLPFEGMKNILKSALAFLC